MRNILFPPQTRMRSPSPDLHYKPKQADVSARSIVTARGEMSLRAGPSDWEIHRNSPHGGSISKCWRPRCGITQVNDGSDNTALCSPESFVRFISDPACWALALRQLRRCFPHVVSILSFSFLWSELIDDFRDQRVPGVSAAFTHTLFAIHTLFLAQVSISFHTEASRFIPSQNTQ